MIGLGSRVRDAHTPFEGIAISRTEHLYAPPQVAVMPTRLGVNGERLATEWFEEARLRPIGEAE